MGILSKLFGLDPKEEEKPVVVKVPTKSVVEPTIKESLASYRSNYTIISCGTYPYEARDENDVIIEEADIVPIPPEILDNNKWKRLKRYTWWRIRLDSVYYFIKLNKDYPSVWELCHGNTRRRFKKIKYVHQHFLFGLELNSDMNL